MMNKDSSLINRKRLLIKFKPDTITIYGNDTKLVTVAVSRKR